MVKNKELPKAILGEVEAEMEKPRLTASVRESVPDANQSFETTGYGRMRPALDLNREFRVEYAMKFIKQVPIRNYNIPPQLDTGCTECVIESVNDESIPDGDYVLHFDNDGVHHVKKKFRQGSI